MGRNLPEQPPHITYLFGAGASCNTMPLVKDLAARINEAKGFFDRSYTFGDQHRLIIRQGHEIQKQPVKNFILEEFEELYKVSGKNATIDTYAKALWLKGDNSKLHKLRFFLALLFCIEQKRMGTDLRYKNFFVSLLEQETLSFPPNIKFLSWNYDLQMEAAYDEIANCGTDTAFAMFDQEHSHLPVDLFASVKLNGTCYFRDKDNSNRGPLIDRPFDQVPSGTDLDVAMKYAFQHFMTNTPFKLTGLNLDFAWTRKRTNLEKIVNCFAQTEILVIIGYSLPFFNRETDRAIIRGMKNLRQIYIQDPEAGARAQSFLSILPGSQIPIEPISQQRDQFFLPPDL